MKTLFLTLFLLIPTISLFAKESAIPRVVSIPDSVRMITVTDPGDDTWILSYSESGWIAFSMDRGRFPYYFKTEEKILKCWISGIKVFVQTDKFTYKLRLEIAEWKIQK